MTRNPRGVTNAPDFYRPLRFGVPRIALRAGPHGVTYASAELPLEPYALRMVDRLRLWAEVDPGRCWMAQRQQNAQGSRGEWLRVSYAQALHSARAIGQALLRMRLGNDRPVVILSGNGIDHALLALGCLYAGIPHCPVSPAYSTMGHDLSKLRHVMDTLTPGLVFASDASLYGKAIAATAPADAQLVFGSGELAGSSSMLLSELLATTPTDEIDDACHETGPDTIVKFMFTSGSTKLPKAVVVTQRMWCANQQQMRQSMPVLTEEPPVLVDWLPWNHTFGGNHNVGLTLYNGGTLYIDEGKPTAAGMAETLRNLREVAPTLYFNVPTGFEMLAQALETDDALRRNLFSRLRMFYFAGAALAPAVWDSLFASAERETGCRVVMNTGLGMTETAPFALAVNTPDVEAAHVGVPAPGLEVKLVPVDGKIEARYRGPNVTPGYWRNVAATREAFDDEGFFRSGDAVDWIDSANPHRGLKFDGRIAEDFKLSTGTFVSVGPLRAKFIAAAAPYVQDVVLTGINGKEVGALVFPTPACRELSGLPADASLDEVLQSAPVQSHFQRVLDTLAAASTGSATLVARAHLVAGPPSLEKGEITDKGSLNQHAVLKHRAALAAAMHDGSLPFTLRAGKVGAVA